MTAEPASPAPTAAVAPALHGPIAQYLEVERCPACGAGFNPGCALHRHLYFETPAVAG